MRQDLYQRYAQSPSGRLLKDACRLPVEQLVSEAFGRAWKVRDFSDLHDFASHPAAILSDGEQAVFVKLSEAPHGPDQFEAELAGLRLLSERAGVQTPPALGILTLEQGVLLVQAAVSPVPRTPPLWREIGRTLARIHQVGGDRCGLDRPGYFGPLYQDNRPLDGWPEFFAERRLWPRLAAAIDSGNLPLESIRQVERVLHRLPGLDLPDPPPVLLHGDAQQNNFISTDLGTFVIDPACFYGSPEYDLALVDYFQAVPEAVFDGYRDLLPIDPGFSARRDLWRIPACLAAVTVGGAEYLPVLTQAVQKYL